MSLAGGWWRAIWLSAGIGAAHLSAIPMCQMYALHTSD